MTQERVDALAEAFTAADEARRAEERMHEAARAALDVGVSLFDIGRVLGVTKQAVHARYAIATSRRRPTASGETLW